MFEVSAVSSDLVSVWQLYCITLNLKMFCCIVLWHFSILETLLVLICLPWLQMDGLAVDVAVLFSLKTIVESWRFMKWHCYYSLTWSCVVIWFTSPACTVFVRTGQKEIADTNSSLRWPIPGCNSTVSLFRLSWLCLYNIETLLKSRFA